MAGYSRLYAVGGLGGFMGADGVNPIEFLILVGDADRQWLEPHYFDRSITPIGRLRMARARFILGVNICQVAFT